jgi:hypothetical protein
MRDRPQYQDGDRLEDGAGSVGYVRECTNRSTGQKFLKVFVVEGPRKGQWHIPEAFGPPPIDWSPDGPHTVCADCERVFHGGNDDMGLRRLWCRLCERQRDVSERRQGQDAGPSHAFGSQRPKVHR